MADDTDTITDEGQRLTALESAVERIEAALSKLVPGSHAEAQQRTDDKLDRPSAIEEQVRAELAKAREEEARQQAEADAKSEADQLKADVAALKETAPKPPVPRRTRLLGWSDG